MNRYERIAKRVVSRTFNVPRSISDALRLSKLLSRMKDGRAPMPVDGVDRALYGTIGSDKILSALKQEEQAYYRRCFDIIHDEIRRLLLQGRESFANPDAYDHLLSVLDAIE